MTSEREQIAANTDRELWRKGGGMTDREREIEERLLANAELTEKALDFMADPEQIEEAKADVALWREAASELRAARAREEQLREIAEALARSEARVASLHEALRYARDCIASPTRPFVDGSELDFDGYNDAGAATAAYYAMCEKWAALAAVSERSEDAQKAVSPDARLIEALERIVAVYYDRTLTYPKALEDVVELAQGALAAARAAGKETADA